MISDNHNRPSCAKVSNSLQDVSIILVTYNSYRYLDGCLGDLYNAIERGCEIIVIDNASTDETVKILRERFPNLCLIESPMNLGFACAVNKAVELSTRKYILLLNPDTIVSTDTIARLVEIFETKPSIGVLGPQLRGEDDAIQHSCITFPKPWEVWVVHVFPYLKPFFRQRIYEFFDCQSTIECDAVSGACFLTTREIYAVAGGLDPRFFMYAEEMDFCYRVRKMGYSVHFTADVWIRHFIAKSTQHNPSLGMIYYHKSQLLYYQKHFGRLAIVFSGLGLFTGAVLRCAIYSVFNSKKAPTFQGLFVWYLKRIADFRGIKNYVWNNR